MNTSILAFSPIFYPHMGGAERTVYELYTRLIRNHGYRVVLVTVNTEGAPAHEVVDGIEVFRIGKSYSNKLIKFALVQILFLWLYARRFAFRKRFDFLHVHYAFHLAPAAALLKLVFRKRLVVDEYHFGTGADIHAADQNPKMVNAISGFIYRIADLVAVISQDNRRFVREVSGKDKAIVIKQGTDHAFFSPRHADPAVRQKLLNGKKHLLVTTSRISARKNLEDMIRAVKAAVDAGVDAVLVINGKVDRGNDAYFAMLQELVRTLDIPERIVFNGFVSDEDLRVVYASADLFLLTSKYEGFGIANVEALASGIPVITYDTGAARDFIVDGENGYVIPSNTPQDLAARIRVVLSDPDLMARMKVGARACVDKELNWDRYAAEHDRLFIQTFPKTPSKTSV